ncbi:MAG: tetratricopeptide repeat protein [Phycisphaerae bacterium]|nr:tetratricopeptide repeat protein [Phycisphaerae bacterium]
MTVRRRPRSRGLRIFVWLVVALIIIGGAGTAAFSLYKYRRQQNTTKLLATARSAVEQNNFDEARNAYRQYLYRKPDDIEAMASYVDLLMNQLSESPRLVGETLSALRKLYQLQPENDDACKKLSDLLLGLREFTEAQALANNWRKRAPNSINAVQAEAVALRGLKRYDEAAMLLESTVADHPDAAALYPLLVALYSVELNNPDTARKWLDEGLKQAPEAPAIHLAAFGYFKGQGDDTAAERHLTEALTLAPNDLDTLYPAIVFFIAQDRLSEADELLKRARSEFPMDRSILVLQADYATQVDKPDVLRKAAEDLLARVRDEFDMDLVARAGELFLTAGDLQQADQCIQQLVEVKEPSVRLTDRLNALRARRALATDQAYAALTGLEELRHRRGDDPKTLELLALAYGNTGAVASARKYYQQLLAHVPDSAAARLAAARFELQQGQTDTARSILERVNTDRPEELQQLEGAQLTADLLDWAAADRPADQRAALIERLVAFAKSPPATPQTARLLARCLDLAQFPSETSNLVRQRETDPETGLIILSARGRSMLARGERTGVGPIADRLIAEPEFAPDGYTLKVRALLADDNLDDAADLARTPELPADIRGRLASVLADHERQAGHVDTAREWFETATKLIPQDVTSRIRLVELSDSLGGAEKWIDQIRAIEGERGLTWRFQRASALMRFGSTTDEAQEAMDLLTACVTERPEWVEARAALSTTQERLGRIDDAIESIQDAIVRQPELADGSLGLRLVSLLKQRGRFDEADRHLARLVNLFPSNPDVLQQRTEQLIRERRISAAAEVAERVLAAGRTDADWVGLTGDLLIAAGKPDRAESILRSALEGQAESTSLQWTLVRALVAQNRQEEAESFLRTSADQNRTAESYLLLARFLELLERPTDAEAAVTAALELAPDSPSTLAAAAEFWGARGDRDRRLDFARRAVLASGKDPQSSLAWAESLAQGGSPKDRAEAEAIVERRLAEDPNDARALVIAGRLAGSAEPPRLEEAAQHLSRAIELQPSVTQAYAILAAVQMRLGKLIQADATIENGLIRQPEDVELLLLRAELDGYRGQIDRTIPTLRRVLELRPRMPQAVARLADAYIQTGAADRGIAFLEQSAGRTPTVAEMLAVGRLYDAQGNHEKARQQFENALKESNGSAEAFQFLLHHLVGQGDYVAIRDLAETRKQSNPDDVSSLAVAAQMLGSHPSDAGMRDLGIRMLFVIASEHPDQAADAMYRAGLCLYQQNDFAAAESRFLEARQLEPASPEPVNALAWLYVRHLKRPKEAADMVREYLAAGGRKTGELLDTYGTALLAAGDYVGAETNLNNAIEIAGQSPTLTAAHFHLGQVAAETNRIDLAREHLLKARELDARLSGLDDADRQYLADFLANDKPLTPGTSGPK